MRCRSALLALCLSFFSAAPVLAQATSSTDAEAHAVFEAGRTAYTAGRFQDALGYFERAYELSHRPELLYNIGQAQDRLRHDADAIATFDRYLAELPDAPQREEVEARLAILRSSSPTTAIETETSPTPALEVAPAMAVAPEPEPAPLPPAQNDVTPWVLIGVGGAIAIAGAVFLPLGFNDIAQVDGANRVRYATVSSAYSEAPIFTGIGWAALGVGVALVGVGVVLAVVGGGGSEQQARLRIGPGGLSLTGSF